MKNVIFVILFICSISTDLKAQSMENLNPKERYITTIAANAAMGDLETLEIQFNEGLDAGLTINEIKEVLVQLYAYCGFPRSIQSLTTFQAVVDERELKGKNDPVGVEPTPVATTDKYAIGNQILEELSGIRQGELSGIYKFAPAIDTFLKEHLWADIFQRGVLSYSQRELATVSAIIALGGLDPMMQSHFVLSMNTGVTEAQLKESIETIREYVGDEKADNALVLLANVVKNQNLR